MIVAHGSDTFGHTAPVRATMLSWEYPPVVVGGLGRHVDALSRQLAGAGLEVDVVTRPAAAAPSQETVQKVEVLRAVADNLAIDFDTESLLAWAATQEHAMVRTALLRAAAHPPDVVHAHDWMVGQAAVTLAQSTGAPLVVTVHATEAGRHHGQLTTPLRRAIDSVERWLVHQADRVITCSPAMRTEVASGLALDPDRIRVIPNGVAPEAWRVPVTARRAARLRLAAAGPVVVYAGRLEWEKGLQTVVAALPELRRRHPDLLLVVAGRGSYEAELRRLVRGARMARAVRWLGHVTDVNLAATFATADVAVVPSLYEPFGLVALEAAAAGVPRVVTDVGGLTDLVRPGRTGLTVAPGDVGATASAITTLLEDPSRGRRFAAAARRDLRTRFGWDTIAQATADVYADVIG